MNKKLRGLISGFVLTASSVTSPVAETRIPPELEGPLAYTFGPRDRPETYFAPRDPQNVPNFLDRHLKVLTLKNMQACLAEFDKKSQATFEQNKKDLEKYYEPEKASREAGYWMKEEPLKTEHGTLGCERLGDTCIWKVEEPYKVQIGSKMSRLWPGQVDYSELARVQTRITAVPDQRETVARFGYERSVIVYNSETQKFEETSASPKIGFRGDDTSQRYTMVPPTREQVETLKSLSQYGAELCPGGM